MKKISKIKLTSLSERELEKRQMKALKGGYGPNPGSCGTITRCNCGSISPSNNSSSLTMLAV